MSTLIPSRLAAEVEYFTDREKNGVCEMRFESKCEPIARLESLCDYIGERAQAARDAHADAEYERRERASARVTFDDVLEQMAGMPDTKKAELMDAYGRDNSFVWLLSMAFADSFEAATDLRVAQGD